MERNLGLVLGGSLHSTATTAACLGTVLGEDQDTVVTSEPCLLPLQDVCPRDGGAGGGDRPFAHRHEGTQVSPSDGAHFLQSPACSSQASLSGKVV